MTIVHDELRKPIYREFVGPSIHLGPISLLTLGAQLPRSVEFIPQRLEDLALPIGVLRIASEQVIPIRLFRNHAGEIFFVIMSRLVPHRPALLLPSGVILEALAGVLKMSQALVEGGLADIAVERFLQRHFVRSAVDGDLVLAAVVGDFAGFIIVVGRGDVFRLGLDVLDFGILGIGAARRALRTAISDVALVRAQTLVVAAVAGVAGEFVAFDRPLAEDRLRPAGSLDELPRRVSRGRDGT